MAIISDLTWQQVADALEDPTAIEVTGTAPNEQVVINIGKLTGDPVSALTSQGVLEFFGKLFYACYQAQVTANTAVATGERLGAFLLPTTTTQAGGYVQISMQALLRVLVAANLDNVTGPNS